jgi:integrase
LNLITCGPAALPGLTTAEIDAAIGYAAAAKSPATLRAYASDWLTFLEWCAFHSANPLPALPGTVAAYLASLPDAGLKAATITRRAAAIAHHHQQAGHETPTLHEGVRAVLRGIRRHLGTAPVRKSAATAEVIAKMLAHCPQGLIGIRDRALLAFGFASAMRRSELVALTLADLTWTKDGVTVLIRRSKTDQEGQGQQIAVPRGSNLRPVQALEQWLAGSEISAGPVFRAVALGGRVSDQPLASDSVARIVQRYARRAGLDPAQFAAHSLRAGYVTSAVAARAPLPRIADQTRHKSLDVLRGYEREADLYHQHSGAAFL